MCLTWRSGPTAVAHQPRPTGHDDPPVAARALGGLTPLRAIRTAIPRRRSSAHSSGVSQALSAYSINRPAAADPTRPGSVTTLTRRNSWSHFHDIRFFIYSSGPGSNSPTPDRVTHAVRALAIPDMISWKREGASAKPADAAAHVADAAPTACRARRRYSRGNRTWAVWRVVTTQGHASAPPDTVV